MAGDTACDVVGDRHGAGRVAVSWNALSAKANQTARPTLPGYRPSKVGVIQTATARGATEDAATAVVIEHAGNGGATR